MKLLRKLALVAGVVTALATPLAAQAALSVCLDDAAGGFNTGTATCVADNSGGDTIPVLGMITTTFGGLTINTAFGEPIFDPGLGMSLSVDGVVTGNWIVAVFQTDMNAGAAGTASFGGVFSGGVVTGTGSATFSLYADDNNSTTFPGTFQLVASGPAGAISGTASVTDPFSMLGLTHLNCTATCFFSTDLTTTVPEPGSIALVGLGLAALGLGIRRRRIK